MFYHTLLLPFSSFRVFMFLNWLAGHRVTLPASFSCGSLGKAMVLDGAVLKKRFSREQAYRDRNLADIFKKMNWVFSG